MSPLTAICMGFGATVLLVFTAWVVLVIIRRVITGVTNVVKTIQHCYPRADLLVVDKEMQSLQNRVSNYAHIQTLLRTDLSNESNRITRIYQALTSENQALRTQLKYLVDRKDDLYSRLAALTPPKAKARKRTR